VSGALCISIDVELAWGVWDRPDPESLTRAAEERSIVRALVAMFERHDVSATWAIVGRLLDRDPARRPELWFAPEVIDTIRAAKVPQDIGSHSYAHVYFTDTPREELRRDLAHARQVHDAHGLPFTSFVFPKNRVAHTDLLAEAGVRVFRSVDRGWHIDARERFGATAGRVANLVDKLLPITPRVVEPIRHGDLVELPSSMLLMARNGLRRAAHPAAVRAKARRGLEAAVETGKTFHLWFHPSNFYFDGERQLAILEDIVTEAASLRRRQGLEIRPMSAYAC